LELVLFTIIISQILSHIDEALLNTSITTGNIKKGAGGSRKFSTRTQLLMFLMYMRQYHTLWCLCWIFGTVPSVCYNYLYATLIDASEDDLPDYAVKKSLYL